MKKNKALNSVIYVFATILILIISFLVIYIVNFYLTTTNRDMIFSGQIVKVDGTPVKNAKFEIVLTKDELFNDSKDIENKIETSFDGTFKYVFKDISSIYIFPNEDFSFGKDPYKYLIYGNNDRTENLKIVAYSPAPNQ